MLCTGCCIHIQYMVYSMAHRVARLLMMSRYSTILLYTPTKDAMYGIQCQKKLIEIHCIRISLPRFHLQLSLNSLIGIHSPVPMLVAPSSMFPPLQLISLCGNHLDAFRFFSSSGASSTPSRRISPAEGASSRFMFASALRYAAWRARVRAACAKMNQPRSSFFLLSL